MTNDVLIIGRDSDTFAAHLGALFPGAQFHCGRNATEALANCGDCEILIIRTDEIFAGLVGAMPKLRLIQALTTGTDHISALPNLPPNVVIAAARGFHGPQMSELAFLFMLAFARKFPVVLENQKHRRWDRREQRLIAGKTVVLVGVGAIAEELARRCQVFGMRVVGVSNGRTSVPGFDAIYPRERILAGVNARQPVAVIGRLSDGTTRDMTAEVRYTVNDEAVISPPRDGVVTAKGRGLTVLEIATALGVSRRTAFRYLAEGPTS